MPGTQYAPYIMDPDPEATEVAHQGPPGRGTANGCGPSLLATVLGRLMPSFHLLQVPRSLSPKSRLASKRSHMWQLWARPWPEDFWFRCSVGATASSQICSFQAKGPVGREGSLLFAAPRTSTTPHPEAQRRLPTTRAGRSGAG